MLKIIAFLFLSFSLLYASETSSVANKMPIIVGGVLETGSGLLPEKTSHLGLVRISPLVGLWLNGMGYFRLAYAYNETTYKPENAPKINTTYHDFTSQLGVALGYGPYLQVSYTKSKQLSDVGDVTWSELGFGLGTYFQLGPKTALISEIEYRSIFSHYNPLLNEETSGSRIQFNFGFVIYVY